MIARLLATALLAAAPVAAADDDWTPARFEMLRAVDARMGQIAFRLATANAPLCDRQAPVPGLMLHALGQYSPDTRDAARKAFGFPLPIAVEAVVPGSPAERVGVRRDDGVRAIAGTPLTDQPGATASSQGRDAALDILARQPAAQPVRVTLATRDVVIPASPGCRATFEVLLGAAMTAQADANTVQIGVRFFERYRDDEVAVVVAHELAHIVLRHRERLEAAGVSNGVLAELGRNGRLHRLAEDQADELGVVLLHNAGYDPAGAARFWRTRGGDIDGGVFRSRTHRSAKARADRIAAVAAALPATRPFVPPLIATRDRPIDQ